MTMSLEEVVNGGSAMGTPSSPIHLAEAMAIRNEGLRERWRREQVDIGSKGEGAFLKAQSPKLRSQGGAGFRTRGNKLCVSP